MTFHKKTIKDIDVTDKTVLLRADYSVPLDDGAISDDYRLRASIPTLEYLLDRNCKVVIISHLGRPHGEPDRNLSLAPVAKRLGELIKRPVAFAEDCTGKKAAKAVEAQGSSEILLLENLRFHQEEEANDGEFAKQLAELAEIFVQDGFGVVHRSHASTEAITHHLPSVAGLLVEKEVVALTEAVEHPKRPLLTIVGGAKVSDKIDALRNFIDQADRVVVGGAIANTFFVGEGINIGKSKYETGQERVIEDIYRQIEEKGVDSPDQFLWLPRTDVAVAKAIDENEKRVEVNTRDVSDDDYILDIGIDSIEQVIQRVRASSTVIWSGPLGYTELSEFARGSRLVAEAIADSAVTSIIGGGDTTGFIYSRGEEFAKRFTHVSTGGGASLDLMSGKKLPGIEALEDK